MIESYLYLGEDLCCKQESNTSILFKSISDAACVFVRNYCNMTLRVPAVRIIMETINSFNFVEVSILGTVESFHVIQMEIATPHTQSSCSMKTMRFIKTTQ